MTINYALYENKLTDKEGDFSARVLTKASADLDDVVDQMLLQGSTITRSDILAVLEDSIKAVEHMLLDGKSVNFGGLVKLTTSIKGTFDGIEDGFNRARHKAVACATAGLRVKKTVSAYANPNKVEQNSAAAMLSVFIDTGTSTQNSKITPANIGAIRGKRLSFDIEKEDEGVFFTAEDGSETKATVIQKSKPSEIVFLIPETLASGTYTITLQYRRNGERLHTAELGNSLTLA